MEFNLQDAANWKAFEQAGGHKDPSKFMNIAGNTVQWTLEISVGRGIAKL